MPHRRTGQETMVKAVEKRSSLDDLLGLIDRAPTERQPEVSHAAARGEAGWPPLAKFRALPLPVWHDLSDVKLSDVKLADALDHRASFRRLCGFARSEPTPEPAAFARFRRELLRHGLGGAPFDEITAQLRPSTCRWPGF